MLLSLRIYDSMIKMIGAFIFLLGVLVLMPVKLQAQNCTLACNNQVNVSIGGACQATITYDQILEGEENSAICSPNAPSDFLVEVMYTPDGPNIPETPVVNQNYVGETLYVKVTHIPTGNFCVGSVLVINQLLPSEVTCPPNIDISVGTPTDPTSTGEPTETDCDDLEISYEDELIDMSAMCNNESAIITRTWTLSNSIGQELECIQQINILRPDVEDVTFPPNLNGVEGGFLDCSDYDLDPSIVGNPNVNGLPISTSDGLFGLTTTYRDEIVPGCGGTFTVVRSWTVVDACVGNVARHDQIILVKDTIAPELICSTETITVSTNSQTDCVANVLIPAVTVTDSCSSSTDVRLITPLGDFMQNGGILTNVPIGTHDITYEATDECGNVGTCTIVLVVEDRTAPTIIGDDRVTVAINDDGIGIIRPDALIIDAFDNCCPVTLEIRRMEETDEDFRTILRVECEDVGTEIMVVVQAVDCFGNTNFSMVPIEVIFKLPPTVICPPDVQLQCDEDFTDLNLTGGLPIIDGICDEYDITFSDDVTLDDCGQGVVLRTFSVAGSAADPVTCVQRIELIDTVALQITYPPEFTTDQCMTPEDIHPDNLPEPFNAPQILGEGCKMLAIGYFDRVLSVNDEVCTKILRTWTVIDWCVFDPNAPDSTGYYEGTQIIKIEDITPPEFVCPENFVFEISDQGPDTLTLPEPVFDECLKDETQFVVSGDLGPGLVHPGITEGIYNITYTLIDICGNTRNCNFQVTVEDPNTGNIGTSPMANCISGLTISIQEDGLAEIWADDFNDNSKDDETAAENLIFRMGPEPGDGPLTPPTDATQFYSCADTGIQVIAMWVGDEDGNWDYCLTLLEIIDEDDFCDGNGSGFTVAGQVNSPTGAMVDGVEVSLMNSQFPPQMTEEKGTFRFANVPGNENYYIELKGKGNPLNGVTTRDLIDMQKHILGIKLFESPYQKVAADTDGSGELSTVDLIVVQRLILGFEDDFRNVANWRFVPQQLDMPETDGNVVPDFPYPLTMERLSQDYLNTNFTAVKTGDVTMDAVFSTAGASPRSLDRKYTMELGAPIVTPDGMRVQVPVRNLEQMNWSGLQWEARLNIPLGTEVGIIEGTLSQIATNIEAQTMSMVWTDPNGQIVPANSILFYLEIPKQVWTKNWFIPSEHRIPSQAIDHYNQVHTIFWHIQEGTIPEFQAQVIPNPFRDFTTMEFSVPYEQAIVLRVWSANGQLVYERRENVPEGSHQWLITQDEIEEAGTYFYQINSNFQHISGQFIRQF